MVSCVNDKRYFLTATFSSSYFDFHPTSRIHKDNWDSKTSFKKLCASFRQ